MVNFGSRPRIRTSAEKYLAGVIPPYTTTPYLVARLRYTEIKLAPHLRFELS